MSVRTIAVCDLCGAQQEIKHAGPLGESEFAKELEYIGWWQRDRGDFQEICPNHPAPAVTA
jgi:hypothetical protein